MTRWPWPAPKKTAEIVTGKVDSTVAVPEGTVGRSELLGRNPVTPSTHLKDAITASNSTPPKT